MTPVDATNPMTIINNIAAMRRHPRRRISNRNSMLALAACILAGAGSGCQNPFTQKNYLTRPISPQELRQIDTLDLPAKSKSPPLTVDQAAADVAKIIQPAPAAEKVELALVDVRAAALKNNLDLAVDVYNPAIAHQGVNAEQAKFESTFVASARRSVTDSPAIVGTEGSNSIFDAYNLGVDVPLRTGGTVSISLPFEDSKTNNPFSLLNPAYQSALQFSISQPLLRNAGVNVNTHSIRVAQYQEKSIDAATKLVAIRILAEADRAYWRLYAARRELEVRQQQYELAVTQLEQARRRVNAGDVAPIEITRAESGVAGSLQGIIVAQSAIRTNQRNLKRVMNRPDLPMDSPTQVITATVPEPVGLNLDPQMLADYAVTNRMEMLELELQLAIDASTIDLRRNQKLPLVTVDYTYSLNGLGKTYGRSFSQLGDNRFNDWSVGVNAAVPIGNEAAKSLYEQAILTRLQRLATKEQRRTAIRQEVLDALDVLVEDWQRILAARQESILAGRTYEGEKRQFEVGLRTSTDVQDALTKLADAQSREVIALADYQIAQVDIAFATGTLLGRDQVDWQPYELNNQQR